MVVDDGFEDGFVRGGEVFGVEALALEDDVEVVVGPAAESVVDVELGLFSLPLESAVLGDEGFLQLFQSL